jgi:hypothetical protein
MALRAVTEHPKFFDLKRSLGVKKFAALGILEALWHFTGKFTPQGDVGRYSDEQIAAWLEWEGDDGALIAALIETGWLDRDAEHRLVIHHWHQHADNATKLAVKRSGKPFISRSADPAGSPPTPHCGDNVATPSQQCGETVVENDDTVGTTSTSTSTRARARAREKDKDNNPSANSPVSHPAGETSETSSSKKSKRPPSSERAEAVEKVFSYYIAALERDPKQYTLTKKRRRLAHDRLAHCLALTEGDINAAMRRMCEAVDGLLANDWFMGRDPKSNGKRFIEFDRHVFGSDEVMEQRWEDSRRTAGRG